MVLDRAAQRISHAVFRDLPRLLRRADRLVYNDSRVLPAKFTLWRATGARIDALFLAERDEGQWQVMLNGGGRLREGEELAVDGAVAKAVYVGRDPDHGFRIRIVPACGAAEFLDAHGRAPLPPYIKPERTAVAPDDRTVRSEYQTIYARRDGSVAAPTAGLHFSGPLLQALETAGIGWTAVTLHIGLGTFQPVAFEDLRQHRMHAELFELSAGAVEAIHETRRSGGRIVAVGTTSVRVLESCADEDGRLTPRRGSTQLLIYPPYRFRAVDALITNFHLPRSTLLALVYAFGGTEFVRRAYDIAIAEKYRFYSFGDAMLIL